MFQGRLLLVITGILCTLCGNAQLGKKIHFKSILIDTHNDIPTTAIDDGLSFDQSLKNKTHSDLERMREGGVDAQFFSIWCDGNKKNPNAWAWREIDTVKAWASRNPSRMLMATSVKEIRKASRRGQLASLLGVEGGHMIEDDMSKLIELHKGGVRYMTLTWNNSTSWATSALDETSPNPSEGGASAVQRKKGLTEFGKEVVKMMNQLGMLVDLSHVGEQTFWDVMKIATKPVLVSHSCVHALCPHRRNLKDEQIKAIAQNGGVIHLNFYSGFVDPAFEARSDAFTAKHKIEMDSLLKLNPEPYFMQVYLFNKYPDEVKALRPPMSMLLDHLDHIVKLVGVDYVGLGSDFDGVNSLPEGLNGVQDFPKITDELIKRGYSKKDIQKILGGNFLRVFAANGN
ncbi:MAG: dipeptidase [Chitinophagaceae bacterium]|nr:dipeptidase [Chitinophagaceae bacterium]